MAAGLGFKNFTSGEVLTAADVNGYLMQGILVFADATARDAAITSPQEGQFAFLKDTNVTTYYTGSAWANVDTTGMTNPMTTTGDTIYSSSGSTPARLGIGTAGQVLTVNSGATAPEWATASAGAFTKITSASFSAVANTSTTFDNVFTSSYKNYVIVVNGVSSAGSNLLFQARTSGPTTYSSANYFHGGQTIPFTGSASLSQSGSGTSWPLLYFSTFAQNQAIMNISNVGNGSELPVYNCSAANYSSGGPFTVGGIINASIAATGFILSVASGTVTGTAYVYGLAL